MFKYRNPNGGGNLRVVTETGHVALVGPEWKKLPEIYHNAAIRAGCECDAPTLAKNNAKPKASAEAIKEKSADEKIRAALLQMIDRDVEGDFTNDGAPNLNVVASLAGMRVTRSQVTPVFKALQDEADAAALDEAGDGEGAGDDGNTD